MGEPTVRDVLAEALNADPDFDDPDMNNPSAWDLVSDQLVALEDAGFRVIRSDPDRVNTDPVVVSCAVRYALGRLSYLPGMIADEVRRCWPHLGHQRDVITKDITEWLAEPWRHDDRPGFEDTVSVWSDLAAWIDRQIDTDTGMTDG
jgi:hypothetical protein